MDGLEEEEVEDEDLQPTENDWQIVDEEPQIEVKMSGEPSLEIIHFLKEDTVYNNTAKLCMDTNPKLFSAPNLSVMFFADGS